MMSQNAVGAPGPRLNHLIGINHKILAQDMGSIDASARGAQIIW